MDCPLPHNYRACTDTPTRPSLVADVVPIATSAVRVCSWAPQVDGRRHSIVEVVGERVGKRSSEFNHHGVLWWSLVPQTHWQRCGVEMAVNVMACSSTAG